MSKMMSKVVADKENMGGSLNAPPSTFSTNDGLWSGCLFDSHCHLNLVHRSELPQLFWFGHLMCNQCRKVEVAEGLPRGSLITLQDSLRRYISILGKSTPKCYFFVQGWTKPRGWCSARCCHQSAPAQIRLALRFNLPLVLHIRDVEDALDGGQAEQDCYRILKSANVPKDYPIHRHCFSGQ